ncbi:MAG: RNA polymerase sigma factor [Gemmatimonadota bacterium]
MNPTSSEVDVDGLASAAAAGEPDAFEALVRIVYVRIYRWALAGVGDADDAEDVTQRVLVALHAKLRGWEGRGRFTTWLYRITANEASSWRRRAQSLLRRARQAQEATVGVVREASAEPTVDRQRLMERVEAHFLRLPRRQREVMDLVDLQGFSPKETAEMLGLNDSTVRANLFKARRALRSRLLVEDPHAHERLEG